MKAIVSKGLLAAVVGALLCSGIAMAKDKACASGEKACKSSKSCDKKGKEAKEPAAAAEVKTDAAKSEEKPAK